MQTFRHFFSFIIVVAAALTTVVQGQHKPGDVPVDYSASVHLVGPLGAAATTMKVHIDAYTTEPNRTKLLTALRTNGYQAFLPAFKAMPVVGYIEIKEQKWDLKWAHLEPRDKGSIVTAATDKPIFFAGGGTVDPKPRTGYEMAIVRMELDTIGMGKGSFSGAARVKPSAGATNVEVDDYANQPATITAVTRVFK